VVFSSENKHTRHQNQLEEDAAVEGHYSFYFAGKVLTASSTLKEAGVANGTKILLMASAGVHQGVSHPQTI
jgi:hypothetical protein